ncbi:MAG: hypothetical protein ACYDCP_04990 [Thermoplasmataceae archaeon]
MKNLRSLSIVVVVAFIAAAMIAPISTAGTVNMVLDPNDNSANLTINASSQLMVKTNATGGLSLMAFKLLEQSFNQNYSYNMTVVAGSNVSHNMNSLLHKFNSNLTVNYFMASVTGNQVMANSTEFIHNYSSSMAMNTTGIFNGSTANLSWRGALSNSNLSGWTGGNTSVPLKYHSNATFGMYDFSGFHKSLSTWNRTYNAATNITTFTSQSSSVTQLSFFNLTSNLTIRYTSDPVYTITVHGDAVAGTNTIFIENPSHGTFTVWYAVAAAVIVVGAIGTMAFRKRRLS